MLVVYRIRHVREQELLCKSDNLSRFVKKILSTSAVEIFNEKTKTSSEPEGQLYMPPASNTAAL